MLGLLVNDFGLLANNFDLLTYDSELLVNNLKTTKSRIFPVCGNILLLLYNKCVVSMILTTWKHTTC